MMMLIALTILVGIVHSAQICRYSGFKEQPFKEIINPNLRMLLQSKMRAIADTDCTLSYQVNTNDGKKAFYPFRIDSSNSIIYGIVTVDNRNNFIWDGCTKEQFEQYLKSCYSDDMPGKNPPQVPAVLSCKRKSVLSEFLGLDEHTLSESTCTWRGYRLQPFSKITNPALRVLIQNALRIGDSDCTLSYQVEKEDNGENFYPFRFDQDQSRFYGIVKKSNGGKLVWIPTNRQTFEKYLDKCYNERAPGSKPPKIPPVLPCSPTRSASTFFRQKTENRF